MAWDRGNKVSRPELLPLTLHLGPQFPKGMLCRKSATERLLYQDQIQPVEVSTSLEV